MARHLVGRLVGLSAGPLFRPVARGHRLSQPLRDHLLQGNVRGKEHFGVLSVLSATHSARVAVLLLPGGQVLDATPCDAEGAESLGDPGSHFVRRAGSEVRIRTAVPSPPTLLTD